MPNEKNREELIGKATPVVRPTSDIRPSLSFRETRSASRSNATVRRYAERNCSPWGQGAANRDEAVPIDIGARGNDSPSMPARNDQDVRSRGVPEWVMTC